MKNEVAVLDPDDEQCRSFCTLLADHDFTAIPLDSIESMNQYIGGADCRAVILNLDKLPVTNKIFREFKKKRPMINIIALSGRQFHPELEEALREHISVCLTQPVDSDELIYWLNTVFEITSTPQG